MNPAIRNLLATRLTRWRPMAQWEIVDDDAARASRELSTSGIAMLGELLSPGECEELYRYFSQREVFDPYRPGDAHFLPHSPCRHQDAHVAHHGPQDVLRAPHLLKLANSPRILGIVSKFLGCKPTIGYLAVWWSYHTTKGAQEAELFHRDVDDWKFVKLFVYLTNVGCADGPHVYVRSSSRSSKLTEIRRFTDEEVRDAFGLETTVTVTGSAGQGFLEDTFGLHKGNPVISGNRLIFQAVYSMSPLPYGPMSPVLSRAELAMQGLDPWTNRAYLT